MKKYFILILVTSVITALIVVFVTKDQGITTHHIKAAEEIIGIEFSPAERKMMLDALKRNHNAYHHLRTINIANQIPLSLLFNPLTPLNKPPAQDKKSFHPELNDVHLPENFEQLAFYPVSHLSQLIKQRKITSTQLTRLYLKRLKTYGPQLKCVITLTEERAMEQAKRADKEISSGIYKGPLHGIPWGAKDLLSTKGIKTTWGAMPYKDQVFDQDATVVQKCEQAGAVLVAKLSMGALAMGDVWFKGKTRNPWNPEQGSSGSSAGSAAATAAGLVGFSIGTETLGSIISPCTRCGVTGLRPTYGRVSRYGAMALSWSMDKIGPICRTVQDCALVFNAIYGPDGKDLSVHHYPFNWEPDTDLKHLRIGYLKKEFQKEYENKDNDSNSLQTLKNMGVQLIPFELPDLPIQSMRFILISEAAAAFDQLTRSGQDELLVRQSKWAWPNSFRQARFIPAVEYIQANRLRQILMREMADKMKKIDVYIAPTSSGNNLLLTNLTGHPAVVIPNGFNKQGTPTSITLVGSLFEEGNLLRIAKALQDSFDFQNKHPDLSKLD
ncbi:MAG: amidase [Candidatus Aminicenantes bacterium]|nr:amidase [Candidatus Aminicenantes bacterium]